MEDISILNVCDKCLIPFKVISPDEEQIHLNGIDPITKTKFRLAKAQRVKENIKQYMKEYFPKPRIPLVLSRGFIGITQNQDISKKGLR